MRISVILVIFLVLLNGWGAMLQEYGVDDHLEINAETGNPEELQSAEQDARDIQTGNSVKGTLLGFYNNLLKTVRGIVVGVQPGVQMLVNIAPPGIAEDLIVWVGGITPFIIAADVLAYARGVDI